MHETRAKVKGKLVRLDRALYNTAMRSFCITVILGSVIGVLVFFAPMGQQQPRDKGSSYNSQRKVVRDPAGRIYIAYTKPIKNFSQVFVQVSEDQGKTWRDLAHVSPPTGDATTPMIAIDSQQNLHVFWTQYVQGVRQIFYTPIEKGKAAPAQALTAGPAYNGFPSAAFDSKGQLHLVWYGLDEGVYQIWYRRRDKDSWSAPLKLSTGFPDSVNPTIATDAQDNVHVAWYQFDSARGVYQIFYRRYSAQEGRWGQQRALGRTETNALSPSIAVDATERVHLVWEQQDDARRFQIAYSSLTERDISPTVWLTVGDVYATDPSIALDLQGRIYVFYAKGDGQIYLRRFDGTAWKPEERLTAQGHNEYPSARWSFYHNPLTEINAQIDYIWTEELSDSTSKTRYGAIAIP
ncbi:MAG: hypothetical protein ACK4HB_01030 [Candidatus Bipolaricaulia bacterium]